MCGIYLGMKHFLKKIVYVCFIYGCLTSPVRAENFYSVASLTLLCGTTDTNKQYSCAKYIRGVVETWMMVHLVIPDSDRSAIPTYCDEIMNGNFTDITNAIREDLKNMEPGLASIAIMRSLSKRYCI